MCIYANCIKTCKILYIITFLSFMLCTHTLKKCVILYLKFNCAKILVNIV